MDKILGHMDNLKQKSLDFLEKDIYSNLSGPTMVAWDLTTRCNMFCQHCFNGSQGGNEYDELDSSLTQKVIEELIELKINSICLCGGEPLLKKETLEIIEKLSQNKISVNMVTNGFLLTEKNINFMAGKLNFLQISIDGANATTHDALRNTKGAFERATSALKMAIEAKIPSVAVSFCPNRKNYWQLPDYVQVISDIGCRNIRMMHFLPQSRGLENNELMLDAVQQYEFQWLLRDQRQKFPNVKIEYGDPLEHIYSYVSQGIDATSVEIRPNGDFTISPYLPLAFGNIKRMSIKEAWNKGLKGAWRNDLTKKLASSIISIYDMSQFNNPWKDTTVVF